MDNFSIMKRNKNAEYKKTSNYCFFNSHFFCPLDDATIVTPHKEFKFTQKIKRKFILLNFFYPLK